MSHTLQMCRWYVCILWLCMYAFAYQIIQVIFWLIHTFTHTDTSVHIHWIPDLECVTLCLCVCLCDGWPSRWPLLRAVTGGGLLVTLGHLGTLITSLSSLLLSALLKATVQPPTPHSPLHHLSASAIHKALINFRPQVSLHHYTFIRGCPYQPAGPEYGNGIPATDKDGLDYPWLSFIR